jgi:GT2 family glycosyltransferase
MFETIARVTRQIGDFFTGNGKSQNLDQELDQELDTSRPEVAAIAVESNPPASWELQAAWPFLPDREVAPMRPDADAAPVTPLDRDASLMNRPKLSVVLGSLNRKDLLVLAIDSVRREIMDLDAEIIVVDGGSNDGTLEWLTQQQDVITIIQYNRIDLKGRKLRKRSWGGFMNMGFRSAAGDAILMISDDCLLLPGTVAAGLAQIEAARQAGIKVGACAFYFRNWPEEKSYYVQRSLGGNLMVNHGIYLREALEDIGYANEEEYVFYKADTDLSLKIWRAGYCIIDAKGAICEHYIGVEEALRQSNNAVMDDDRKQMAAHWPALTSKAAVSKMGKIMLDRAPCGTAQAAWGARYRAELEAANANKVPVSPKPEEKPVTATPVPAASTKPTPTPSPASRTPKRTPQKAELNSAQSSLFEMPEVPVAAKPVATKPAAKKQSASTKKTPARRKPAASKPAAKPKTATKPKSTAKPRTAAKPKTAAKPNTAAKPKPEAKPEADATDPATKPIAKAGPKSPRTRARAATDTAVKQVRTSRR